MVKWKKSENAFSTMSKFEIWNAVWNLGELGPGSITP